MKTTFLFIIIIFVLSIILWYCRINTLNTCKSICKHNEPKQIQNKDNNNVIISTRSLEPRIVNTIDRYVDGDNLTEPVQRYPSNYYPPPPLSYVTNIHTQGLPDSFSYIGNLFRHTDNKLLKLYGRRRYGDIWDYYALDTRNDIKVNITNKNQQQISTGDSISVDIYPHSEFTVLLHRPDEFTYSPYLI